MFSFCMYCCKQRCITISIAILSVFFALTAAVSIYLVKRLRDESMVWNLQEDPLIAEGSRSQGPDVETIKLTVFWGIVGISGLTILLGLLGIVTSKTKTCCTISLYSFLTLLMFVAYLIIGGLLLTVTIAADFHVDAFCKVNNSTTSSGVAQTTAALASPNTLGSLGPSPTSANGSQPEEYNEFTINFSRYFLSYVTEYERVTSRLIYQYMCTKDCPCLAVNDSLYPNGYLYSDMNQLVFDGTYTSFSQCYNDLVASGKLPQRRQVSASMLEFIRRIEDKYQCSTICQSQQQFGFYTDIRDGVPQFSTCGSSFKMVYNEYLGILSLLLLATSLVLFCAFNTQYGLWRRRFQKDHASGGGCGSPSRSSDSARGWSGSSRSQSSQPVVRDRQQNYLVEGTAV